jgi:phage gp29-like protein
VIASSLDTRKDGVLAKPRRVLPASDRRQDKRIAAMVEESLEAYFDTATGRYSGFEQVLYEMLDAIGKGVVVGEIIYAPGSDRIYIEDVKFKPQHLFSFNDGPMSAFSTPSYLGLQTGPLRLRQAMGYAMVREDGLLDERKFLVASYRPQYGNRWGSPLDRKVFWPSWFKRASVKQWLRYLEKGPGSVVSRYADSASADEKGKALAAARAVNEEGAVALPTKFQIEVLEHVRQSMGTAYEGMADGFCNNAIMRVILGQTLTSRGSEGGGSRALGEVHNQVRGEKIEADSKFLMYNVNTQLVWPLVLLNEGPNVKPPRWVIDYNPARDLSAHSIYLTRLVDHGLKVPTRYAHEEYQIPEPAEGEEVLTPSGSKPGTPASGVDPAAEFAEKKTSKSRERSASRSNLRMERFSKLRPSMMRGSGE